MGKRKKAARAALAAHDSKLTMLQGMIMMLADDPNCYELVDAQAVNEGMQGSFIAIVTPDQLYVIMPGEGEHDGPQYRRVIYPKDASNVVAPANGEAHRH